MTHMGTHARVNDYHTAGCSPPSEIVQARQNGYKKGVLLSFFAKLSGHSMLRHKKDVGTWRPCPPSPSGVGINVSYTVRLLPPVLRALFGGVRIHTNNSIDAAYAIPTPLAI